MKDINISVVNKIATNTTPDIHIVCGNSSYTVTFDFDEEWNAEAAKVARFVYYKGRKSYFKEQAFTGNIVNVPILSGIDYVLVGVYAGELSTTTPARVLCKRSILCGGAEEQITPEEKETLHELISQMMAGGGLTDADKQSIIAEVVESLKGSQGGGGISVTHSWDGTVLTVTSASGTSSADLKGRKGDKGDKGDPGDPGSTPEKGEDYWTSDDKQEIIDDVIASDAVAQIIRDIQGIKDDMNYKEISIGSISNNIGTVEKGVSVSEMEVTWTLNKAPVSQTLGGEAVDVTARKATVSMEGRTSVTLVVTDERDKTASKSTGYNAYNGVYYGVLEDGAEINRAAILSLNKKIQGSRTVTFTVNPGSTQRIAFAIPTGYGTPTFKDASTGFQADMTLAKGDFTFKNVHEYETTYNVWLSTNIVPGSITVAVT